MISRGTMVLGGLCVVFSLCSGYGCAKKERVESTFQGYVKYLRSVYEIMDKNYFVPVNEEVFKQYLDDFRTKIFEPQVEDKTKMDEGIKHIATGILVTKLKSPVDPFTNFFPPQMVKEFKEEALGYAGDVGLDGYMQEGRFIITHIEPRSDAAKKGIQVQDEIIKIEGMSIAELSEEAVKQNFSLPLEQELMLEIFSPERTQTYSVTVVSTQYFKQSIFTVPTEDPRAACLKIKFFNEESGNDMRSLIAGLNEKNINKLVLDLRDNAGGPPLAAWDMSGIFLDANQKLFYFLKRNDAPTGLISPESPVSFKGDLVILINKSTGSAAELFAGIMQSYNRARLFGENSAGQVYLKSLFDLEDGATLELTVAKGYLFTGDPIDTDGLKPDVSIPDGTAAVQFAVNKILE